MNRRAFANGHLDVCIQPVRPKTNRQPSSRDATFVSIVERMTLALAIALIRAGRLDPQVLVGGRTPIKSAWSLDKNISRRKFSFAVFRPSARELSTFAQERARVLGRVSFSTMFRLCFLRYLLFNYNCIGVLGILDQSCQVCHLVLERMRICLCEIGAPPGDSLRIDENHLERYFRPGDPIRR